MRIAVSKLGTNVTQSMAWRDYVATHPDSTTYHSLEWRTILEESFGYRSWLLMAHDEDSGTVQGLLPLYLVTGPLARRLVAVPFRDRGGPIWSSPEALEALLSETENIMRTTGARFSLLKSLAPFPRWTLSNRDLKEHLHWVHSLVSLVGSSPDLLWKQVGTKTRNMIRQAEAHRLTFAEVTEDPGSLDCWYRLHLLTQKRLGVPPFPRRFFLAMLREFGKTRAINLYSVRHDDQTLAATIVLRHRATAIYGYSASSADAKQLRANDLMLYRLITQLIEENFTLFDMGSDSSAQDSLLFYKRKWGAKQGLIPSYTLGEADLSLTDSSSANYLLARKLFGYLPTPVSALAGCLVTRFLG